MRLAFLGTPDFAATTLAALIAAGHDIAAVYSQPARPAGRGQQLVPSPVEALARQHGLEMRTPISLKDPSEQAVFAALDLDVAVVAAYGLILPRPILDAPRYGCLNVHASLLPRWRGAAPIQRSILAGDAETGVAIMQMEAGLDTGPMIRVERVPITASTTGGGLTDDLAALGARMMVDVLAELFTKGSLPAVTQPEEGVTYAAKIDKAELKIDWSEPAVAVERRIRAFAPKPGAFALLAGDRIRILAAEVVAGSGEPGTALDDTLTIACGEGAVRITSLQRAGRGVLDAATFQRGTPITRGSRFDP